MRYLLPLLALLATHLLHAQTNTGFENGLTGWTPGTATDSITFVTDIVHAGHTALRIGKTGAELTKRINIGPLELVSYDVFLRTDNPNAAGYSFIRFYDRNDHLLIEYKADPVTTQKFQQSGYYTESPANTAYCTIGIRKTTVAGFLYADDFTFTARPGETSPLTPPSIDLDQYLRPFWKSDTIVNETVLLYSVNGLPATGRLLFQPDKILSVTNYGGTTVFRKGLDYTLKAGSITATAHTAMPFRADTSFDRKNNLAWYNIQSQWISVTYTHKDKWEGPTPVYKGSRLPNTMTKLKAGQPLTIVAFGMSITRGMNVSGYDGQPPYMPPYVSLFVRQLKKAYQDTAIRFYNAALPGSRIDWAAQYVDQYVTALSPDLVILDFGMNDFWWCAPDQFSEYARTIITKIRAVHPLTEFLLVSNMKFDPEYVLDSDPKKEFYQSNMIGYNTAFQSLETTGIVDLDMTTISDRLYTKKKAKDCIANPLHPNDYMARWYAQTMSALLIE